MNWTWAEMRDNDCSIMVVDIQMTYLHQKIGIMHNQMSASSVYVTSSSS